MEIQGAFLNDHLLSIQHQGSKIYVCKLCPLIIHCLHLICKNISHIVTPWWDIMLNRGSRFQVLRSRSHQYIKHHILLNLVCSFFFISRVNFQCITHIYINETIVEMGIQIPGSKVNASAVFKSYMFFNYVCSIFLYVLVWMWNYFTHARLKGQCHSQDQRLYNLKLCPLHISLPHGLILKKLSNMYDTDETTSWAEVSYTGSN